MLRMLGVDGLDRLGRPLAASLLERYCGSDPGRLARGVILPFVVALLEYDLAGARAGARGGIGGDRPWARGGVAGPAGAACRRRNGSDAASRGGPGSLRRQQDRGPRDARGPGAGRRTMARRRPQADEIGRAARETKTLLASGADVVLVRVPASWEFAEARRHVGLETPGLFDFRPRGKDGESAARRGDGRRGRGRLTVAAAPGARSRTRGQPARPGRASARRPTRRGRTGLLCQPDDRHLGLRGAGAGRGRRLRARSIWWKRTRSARSSRTTWTRSAPWPTTPSRIGCRRVPASRVVMGAGPLALGADVASGSRPTPSREPGAPWRSRPWASRLALADGLARRSADARRSSELDCDRSAATARSSCRPGCASSSSPTTVW